MAQVVPTAPAAAGTRWGRGEGKVVVDVVVLRPSLWGSCALLSAMNTPQPGAGGPGALGMAPLGSREGERSPVEAGRGY